MACITASAGKPIHRHYRGGFPANRRVVEGVNLEDSRAYRAVLFYNGAGRVLSEFMRR